MTEPMRVPREGVGRDGWLVFAIVGSLMAVFIAVVGVGFGMRAIGRGGER